MPNSASEHDPRIEIGTAEHGILSLQAYVSDEDLIALNSLVGSALDAREFTVRVLARVIREPRLTAADLRSWNDDVLAAVALSWAGHREVGWKLGDEGTQFERFRVGLPPLYRRLIQGHGRTLASAVRMMGPALDVDKLIPKSNVPSLPTVGITQDLLRGINQVLATSGIAEAAKAIQQMAQQPLFEAAKLVGESLKLSFADVSKLLMPEMSAITSSLVGAAGLKLQDVLRDSATRVFDSLPDLGTLARTLQEYAGREEKAIEALDETGFGFLADYWYDDDLAMFLGMDKVDPRVRHAVMTKRLLSLTNSSEFRMTVEKDCATTSLLRRRWKVLDAALHAHGERAYCLSIPPLYAQVEGMFTDALLLKGAVVHQNGKLYARKNGRLKLNKKGKPIEVHGLKQAIYNCDLTALPLLEPMGDALMNQLFADRDGVMHGRKTDYDQAKRSVTLVLAASILATLFADVKP